MSKPTWQSEEKPSRIITDPSQVMVSNPKEVARFHVAVKRGEGFSFTLTTAASDKLRRKMASLKTEHNSDTFYEFDYGTQEAVIYIDGPLVPLVEFCKTL